MTKKKVKKSIKKTQKRSAIVLTAEIRMIDARGAAALCNISARFWARLDASGKVPKPLKLGRRCLWSVAELDSWIAAGCPAREQ